MIGLSGSLRRAFFHARVGFRVGHRSGVLVDALVLHVLHLDLAADHRVQRHLPEPRSGRVAKALWVIFVILVPYLGVFVYLIARGHKMQEHAVEAAQAQDTAMRQYVQSVATVSPADELAKLADSEGEGRHR